MAATPVDLITALSGAVKEVTTLIREWIAGSDLRRMRAAINAAEQYIMTNESGSLSEVKKRKELSVLKVRFFKFNN